MIRICLLTFVLLIAINTIAQSPNVIRYQALVRDAQGSLVVNKTIGIKISVCKDALDGESVFSERHVTLTSAAGIVNIEIGRGTAEVGNLSEIEWGKNEFFIKTEIDIDGGSNYQLSGSSQLVSVPYALHANTSGDEKWSKSVLGIFQHANVGIGHDQPAYPLDVAGAVNATGYRLNGQIFAPTQWSSNVNSIFYSLGAVGIGTSSPSTALDIDGGSALDVLTVRTNANSLGINAYVTSNTDFHGSAFIGRRARGSKTNPLSVMEGDRITGIYGSLFSGGSYHNAGAIHFYAGKTPGELSYPINIRFETTNSGEVQRKERMRISENGFVGIGKTDPMYMLDVLGSVNASEFRLNGQPFSLNPWTSITNGISYIGGDVGIGTNLPTTALDIDGGTDLNVLTLRTAGNSLGLNAYVSSNADFHGSAFIGRRARGSSANPITVLEGDRITGIYGSLFADHAYQNSAAVHMYVGKSPGPGSYPSNIRFETTGTNQTIRTERLRITEDGLIESKTGDIFLSQVGTGVIMKSPDGACWRMTVNNSGNPVFTAITCPQ